MAKFELVQSLFGDVPYMRNEQASILRDLIISEGARDILEVGFYRGKSSAYIAAILEDIGAGSLATFDMESARRHSPNIETILEKTGLSHRVTPFFCKRSYTWELQRLINASDRPQFDFCYFDGGHTWDLTGFGVVLVDILLRPGGVILLDNMDWSMSRSPHYRKNPQMTKRYDQDEVDSKPVRMVWDTILTHFGYEHIREYKDQQWGLARKPG